MVNISLVLGWTVLSELLIAYSQVSGIFSPKLKESDNYQSDQALFFITILRQNQDYVWYIRIDFYINIHF